MIFSKLSLSGVLLDCPHPRLGSTPVLGTKRSTCVPTCWVVSQGELSPGVRMTVAEQVYTSSGVESVDRPICSGPWSSRTGPRLTQTNTSCPMRPPVTFLAGRLIRSWGAVHDQLGPMMKRKATRRRRCLMLLSHGPWRLPLRLAMAPRTESRRRAA